VTKVVDGKFKTPVLDDMTPPLPSVLVDVLRGILPEGLN